MGSFETAADDRFVGLGPDAEERLPAGWVRRRQRAGHGFVLALLVGIQFAWLAALAYATYVFFG